MIGRLTRTATRSARTPAERRAGRPANRPIARIRRCTPAIAPACDGRRHGGILQRPDPPPHTGPPMTDPAPLPGHRSHRAARQSPRRAARRAGRCGARLVREGSDPVPRIARRRAGRRRPDRSGILREAVRGARGHLSRGSEGRGLGTWSRVPAGCLDATEAGVGGDRGRGRAVRPHQLDQCLRPPAQDGRAIDESHPLGVGTGGPGTMTRSARWSRSASSGGWRGTRAAPDDDPAELAVRRAGPDDGGRMIARLKGAGIPVIGRGTTR